MALRYKKILYFYPREIVSPYRDPHLSTQTLGYEKYVLQIWETWYTSIVLYTVNPRNAVILLHKPWRPRIFFNLKLSYMSQLALSGSFEYLCYGV